MSPDRTFFRAEDFVPKLERWAAAIRRGDPWAHEAEEFAKTKLWGPTKKPVSLREGLALTQEDDGDDALRATA